MTDKLLYRAQCPRCAENGKDRSQDNLAIYSDGHKYCYRCQYFTPPNRFQVMNNALYNTKTPTFKGLDFPEDFTKTIPILPHLWLKKYNILEMEIENYRIGWSPSLQQIIFPVFDAEDAVIFWQGRNFKTHKVDKYADIDGVPVKYGYKEEVDGPKYVTHGSSKDLIHIVGNKASTTLIIVEDLISAIKVGRMYMAMPLWGSSMPLETVERLKTRCTKLGIWLDPDKRVESVKMALRASLVIPQTFVMSTNCDPKEYTTYIISQTINNAIDDTVGRMETGLDTTVESNSLPGDVFEQEGGVCL